jgi:hypothetical protein
MTRPAGGRRELAYAVVACLAGAGLAVFAATRTWVVEEGYRVEPLPPLGLARSGADLVPWLPAVALVGLAGAGAVLATRGVARLVAGMLLCGCGLAVAAGAATRLGGGSAGWPVAAALGGLILAAAGVLVVWRGRRWPALGARYERRPAGAADPTRRRERAAGDPGGDPGGDAWAALDRGEDPTDRPA